MQIKTIIFDFDGTLFDSMHIWETAGADYLASLGYVAAKDLGKQLKPMSLQQSAEYLKQQYALPMEADEIMDGINQTVEDFYLYHVIPKGNVISMLSAIHAKGIRMCICTATDRYQVEAALKRCKMINFFDEIITCTEVGHGKDEPYIYEYACRKMGASITESIVIEDAYHAAKTAKEAGFFVVGVFDRYEEKTIELQELADVYVSSFSDFPDFFNF